MPDGADAVSHATPAAGNTKDAAMEIQRQTGGDLFAIKTVQNYPVGHGECSLMAEEEMKLDVRPELTEHVEDMSSYDTVYLGFPLWWYQEPMAVRTFLEEYDFSGKFVVPFCTSLGAGIEKSEKNVQTLCPNAVVLDGLALRTEGENFAEMITGWLAKLQPQITGTERERKEEELKVKITVGNTELIAKMEKNATTQALIEQMPMTLPMMDLYGREMCYRYGAYALPTDNLQSDGYQIGDIAYWAPGGSLVILYEQNGERFERQHLGHIDAGVEVFKNTGDTEVRFELVQ